MKSVLTYIGMMLFMIGLIVIVIELPETAAITTIIKHYGIGIALIAVGGLCLNIGGAEEKGDDDI